jgi:chaperone modulatory protein CbpM
MSIITIESACLLVQGLEREELEKWIAEGWVKLVPGQPPMLTEIDVARIKLIHELRNDLGIDDTSMPIVLSLLDQLYEERRWNKHLLMIITK